MARATWKGAIVFGLVHIPVDLYPGARDNDLDFDWIDQRDMAPVGYQRINKKTGKPVESKDIVKGYAYERGHYVLLSDEDFRLANPKATQTIEILAFVDRAAIDPAFFDTPYRLAPGKRGEKPYALLRETLKRAGKVGVAQVVIRTKQHLALVMAEDAMLRLMTLRYAEEILDDSGFELPPADPKKAGLSEKELDLAQRLVEDMTEKWKPEQYHDTYRDDLMKRIEAKVKSGETEVLAAPSEAGEERGAEVIDLMAALRRSLGKGSGATEEGGAERSRHAANDEDDAPTKRPPRKAAAKARAKPDAKAGAGKHARKDGATRTRRRA